MNCKVCSTYVVGVEEVVGVSVVHPIYGNGLLSLSLSLPQCWSRSYGYIHHHRPCPGAS